ncbi:MAG TPA: sulfite exporter TauE/SafE family protein [Solirubrobacterales bacterium]|nr:sulfite exporter TauE/SafE family protein [Solirubrobacterales bacterium]
MDALEALAILAAGVAAGAINAIVGSGTLITFPVLVALGYQPLVANVSNNIGLVPGAVAGVFGYRRELEGQRPRAIMLGVFSIAGGVAGATLLLVLPASAFEAIVPALIAIALVLVIAQPRIDRALAHRPTPKGEHGVPLRTAVTASGVYGGYFGAGQGILLISILGIGIRDRLQRLNGLKNVLAGLVNATAGVIFVFAANVDWGVAALIAAGSIVGALVGAHYGRRLEPNLLRAMIVVVGLVAIIRLLLD